LLLECLADAHVDANLFQPRQTQSIRPAELLRQLVGDLFLIAFLQPRHDRPQSKEKIKRKKQTNTSLNRTWRPAHLARRPLVLWLFPFPGYLRASFARAWLKKPMPLPQPLQ